MPFTIEVYNKENGICVDRITAYSVREEGDWYKIDPVREEGYRGPFEYRMSQYEITTKSFLEKGKTLMVKNRFDRTPQHYPNVSAYKKVDLPDGFEYLRVEYRPWGQDRIQSYMIDMSMVENWEEQ